jgi:hypothetical protein
MGAATYRSVSTETGTSTSAAGTVPAGSVAGDYLVAAVRNMAGTPSAISAVPTGWGSALQTDVTSSAGDDVQMTLYAKVSTGEAGPFTWTLAAGDEWTVDIVAVTGGGISQVSAIQDNSTSDKNHVAPTVTATGAALLLGLWAFSGNTGPVTESPMTEQSDANGMVVATEDVAAGATGTRTAVSGTSTRSVGALLALTTAANGDLLLGSM